MKSLSLTLVALATLLIPQSWADGVKPSVWVYPSDTYGPNLLYGADTNGVRINDFSECGYRRGLVELPNVTNLIDQSRWLYLHPLGGGADDGAGINAALRFVGAYSLNSNGFRGVVSLSPGEFIISSTNAILLTNDGVVLKGSGSSPSSGTRLRADTLSVYSLITIQGDPNSELIPNASITASMTEPLVPAGTRTFRVNTTDGFNVGDEVLIVHTATANWIHDLDMDKLNKVWLAPDNPAGSFERVIERIEGNWLTVNTPIPQTFQAQYGGGTVQPFIWAGRVQNCGVEDLYCYSNFRPLPHPFEHDDPVHAGTAIQFVKAKNAWARNVVAQYFGYFTFQADQSSKFLTIAECQNLTPVSPISGGYRYSFHLDHEAQYVLFRDCYAIDARHDCVLSSLVPGPNAFVRCSSANAHEASGPHERWSTGTLFDNVSQHDDEMQSSNLGNGGGGSSAHGWAGACMVFWNCFSDGGFRVRNPPSSVNWLVGSNGEKMASKRGCWYNFLPFVPEGDCWAVGADPDGTYDQSGEDSPPVQLHSLYYAQLQQRLLFPNSKFREYRLGDIDHLVFTPGIDDQIPLDPGWLAAVHQIAGTATVTNLFDSMGSNQWTAFTFNVPSVPGEQIVAGSLTLGLHAGLGSSQHYFYEETVDVAQSFTNLGWNVATNGISTHTIPIHPGEFLDNKLNLALSPNCGVDFAMLTLQVAPITTTSTQSLVPIDTYVRGGDYANQNFATNLELIVKQDGDDNFKRRAFLDWNLGEVRGALVDAKVQLYCTYSGQDGNEQSVAVVPDDTWSPNSVTWNTQPRTAPPFAYWTPEGPGFYSQFAVTPQVAAVLASPDKHLRLCLDSAGDWGGHGDVAYASREDPNSAHHPQLILSFSNSTPVILGPAAQSMSSSSTRGPLAVTIGDAETSASGLTLTGSSSDQAIISDSNITLGGSGSNRTVTLRSSFFASGRTIITLRVSDGLLSATTSFPVSINANSTPTISQVTNQTLAENGVLSVPFTVGDFSSSPNDLTITVSNSNPILFPPGNVVLPPPPDSSGNRTLVFTPAMDRWGTNTTRIHVDNGFSSADRTFLVTVLHVEQPPKYVQILRPLGGDNSLPAVPLTIVAKAFDVDGDLARVQFYHQGVSVGRLQELLGVSSNAPYSVTWTNPTTGAYTLYAVAYDTTGLSATSPAVNLSVSVPIVPQPRLFIAPASNALAVVWSTSLASNVLQSTTSLTPPILWTPVTAPPLEDDPDASWIYFVSPTDPRRFFRLAQ